MSCNLICLWFWIRFIAAPFDLSLSRIGEAENPGPVCATAKLFGAKYDTIGQWAQSLSFFKKVSRVAVVNMFCRIFIFVAWKVRSEVTLFVIARPEEDANTLGRDASWSFLKVW